MSRTESCTTDALEGHGFQPCRQKPQRTWASAPAVEGDEEIDQQLSMEEQFKITVDAQRAPVIEPGYTFGTVTEKISAIVLTRPASNGCSWASALLSCSR